MSDLIGKLSLSVFSPFCQEMRLKMLQDFFPILLSRREDRTQATALKKGLNSYIVAFQARWMRRAVSHFFDVQDGRAACRRRQSANSPKIRQSLVWYTGSLGSWDDSLTKLLMFQVFWVPYVCKKLWQKNNAWKIRRLVDESFVPSTQNIILKIVRFLAYGPHALLLSWVWCLHLRSELFWHPYT